MKPKQHLTLLLPVVLILICALIFTGCKEQPAKTYEPTWESLSSHPTPQWFMDAKFGIFIHWGVYAVPAFHEWYLEYMSPRSNWGQSPLGPPYIAAQGDMSDSAFNAGLPAASIVSKFDSKARSNLNRWKKTQTNSVKKRPK